VLKKSFLIFVLSKIMWEDKIKQDKGEMTIKFGTCALIVGYIMVHTQTPRIWLFLFLYFKDNYAISPQC